MPALAKTSAEDIVLAATELVDRNGAEALTMQAVAAAVGIKGPSLYKRFPTRDLLLDEVARLAMLELGDRLAMARTRGDPLEAMARAYRAFGKKHPRRYALLYSARPEGGDLNALRAELVRPLLEALEPSVGAAHALHGARLFVSWLHGFLSMEQAGAFHLGGDVNQAFDFGLAQLLRAVRG